MSPHPRGRDLLAGFLRELIVIGTREGRDVARARGRVGGRRTVVDDKIVGMARVLLHNPDNSIASSAKMLGVCPGTLHNRIPDLRELRAGGLVPRQSEVAE